MSHFFSFLLALYLSFNFNQGSILELSDGSKWRINPDDTKYTSLWLVPMEIQIESSDNPSYPFILNNLQTKQKVKASKL
jgi:hypothetical protein